MANRRHRDFRLGDRSELLAEFCLNTMAFTTRVPRQEDIGHDLFCVLAEKDGDNLYAGPFFTVQVKSNRRPLRFREGHERRWINQLENPFFVVVANKKELRIDIYTTWMRLLGTMYKGDNTIVLKPGEPTAGDHHAYHVNGLTGVARDGSEQVIWLGKPIISGAVSDFMQENKAEDYAKLLKHWILIDNQNIVNAAAGTHIVTGPAIRDTNQEPTGLGAHWWLLTNPKNLNDCQQNLVRTATLLRRTIDHAQLTDDPQYADKISTLDCLLRAYKDLLGSPEEHILRRYCGLDLDG